MKRDGFRIVWCLDAQAFKLGTPSIILICALFSICFCLFLPFNILIMVPYDFQVNGDTLFMTGNFKEFKVENHANDTWDENNAVTTTAVCSTFITNIFSLFTIASKIIKSNQMFQDYLASIDSASQAGFDMK